MQEAELASELMIALMAGLQDKKKSLNIFYERYDPDFPAKRMVENRFESIITFVDKNLGDTLQLTAFRRRALFYSLFLAVADVLYGIPNELGPVNGFPKGRLPDQAVQRWRNGLESLSKALRSDSPESVNIEFVNAAARQTDNIGPRRIRHRVLVETLLQSLE
jgi:hypothetical protein